MRTFAIGAGAVLGAAMAVGAFVDAPAAEAQEGQWWPAKVQVYNPSCTDGDPKCWTDERNTPAKLEVIEYVPLMPNEVGKKHHICVSFPHLKDSYWVGAAYGIIEEGKRLGQKITLVEAAGYTNLEKQIAQVEDCVANGAEAVVIGAISADGNAKQVDELRAKGIKVIDLINGINTEVDAKSLESYYNMGYVACKWVADQHPAGSGKIKAAWFPGPPGAGWSVAGNDGCAAAVAGSDVELVDTKWGDTGKEIQLGLVEDVLQAHADLSYLIGTAPTAEAAVSAVRDRDLQGQIKVVGYYYTPGMHMFIGRGQVAMAPTDQMIIQCRIAIDQAVRLLEGKPFASGGRPEYNDTGRVVEHVQPVVALVTPESIKAFDTATTLAPDGWTPVFSVD
ncbi:MAG: TMAO reductase system periplasmic protein TorT [Alphaproteobacteria bacterium]